MEIAKTELVVVEVAITKAHQEASQIPELNDLQMAMIGGGTGDVSWG